jgi:hypothetical protein
MLNKIDKIFNWFASIENNNIFNISLGISFVIAMIGALLFKFNFFIIGSIMIIIPFGYLFLLLIFSIIIGLLEFIVFIIKKYKGRLDG